MVREKKLKYLKFSRWFPTVYTSERSCLYSMIIKRGRVDNVKSFVTLCGYTSAGSNHQRFLLPGQRLFGRVLSSSVPRSLWVKLFGRR